VAAHAGPTGAAILVAAKAAFIHGMGSGALVAAIVAAAGGVVALLFLPSRAADAIEIEVERPEESWMATERATTEG
jgi:hypothetical protein